MKLEDTLVMTSQFPELVVVSDLKFPLSFPSGPLLKNELLSQL